LNVHL